MRSAGSWTDPESSETARFPRGGRVGHGCVGSAIARETDVGENVAAAAGMTAEAEGTARHWQSDPLSSAAKTLRTWRTREDTVRRRVAVGGGAAVGGRYGRDGCTC